MTESTTADVQASPHIRTAVVIVAEKRRAAQEAKAALTTAYTAFDLQHAGLIAAAQQSQAAAVLAELELRALAEAHFMATQNRTPAPGVEIQLEKVYDINDAVVLGFAQRTGIGLVPETVDLKALKSMAKNPRTPVEGITVREIPKAKIATDLEKALAQVVA